MALRTQNRLLDFLKPHAGPFLVSDLRIGLGYTIVRLDNGCGGVAWTPRVDAPSCTHHPEAGTLANRPAGELLAFLVNEKSDLNRAIGLATANALLASLPRPVASKDDVIVSLNLTLEDKVVMVGYFSPLIPRLRQSGCSLQIVELHPHPQGETIRPDQAAEALAGCSVAIVTGTSIINGTCDDVLDALGHPRAAVLLGPSSPLCPEAFSGTKLTHIAGARVRDTDAVLRIISEGGGTMLTKKYMDFEIAPVG